MGLSIEFVPKLSISENYFLLDSVEDTVIVEDTTEEIKVHDSVMIVDNSVEIIKTVENVVNVEDNTVIVEDTVENIVIDDSVTIVDTVTVEDTIEIIVIDDSVTIVDTVMVENVVEDCIKMDIDDSLNTTADSYTSDRSRSRKYMSECPIHNHHMDGTWESICPDDGPCNCM